MKCPICKQEMEKHFGYSMCGKCDIEKILKMAKEYSDKFKTK